MARENVKLNGLEERIQILTGDLRTPPPVLAAGSFDWVLSNPPYWPATTHLLPEAPALAQAKFELDLYPAGCGGRGSPFLPRRWAGGTDPPAGTPDGPPQSDYATLNWNRKGSAWYNRNRGLRPHRVLVEAQKLARPGLKVLAPFPIQGADGNFSPEMVQVYQGKQLGADVQ